MTTHCSLPPPESVGVEVFKSSPSRVCRGRKQTLELFGILKRLPKAPLVTQPPLPQKADGAVEKDLSQYQHVFQSRF